jgi:hypothetical protein
VMMPDACMNGTFVSQMPAKFVTHNSDNLDMPLVLMILQSTCQARQGHSSSCLSR